MSIYIADGDLLKSDCDIIAHQSNCFSTMGSGIAKQIASKYPNAYLADKDFPYSSQERLGKFSFTVYKDIPLVIFNLYGQYRYGREKQHTDYDALESALDGMFDLIQMNICQGYPVPKIGLPYGLGSGLAGGHWGIIYNIIERLSNKHELDVYLYKL